MAVRERESGEESEVEFMKHLRKIQKVLGKRTYYRMVL